MNKEDIIRIEKSSDLVFPESSKVSSDVLDVDVLESKSGIDVKGAILGGIASGIAFFGVTAIIDRVRDGNNDEIEEVLEELVEE